MNRHTSVVHSPDNREMSVIIPAAGMGKRMKSYGPKSLIKVGDSCIIDRQLKYISKYFYRPEVIIVTGFESDKVQDYLSKRRKLKIVENKNWEHTNVVGSINEGLKNSTKKNVIIIYGDLVFNAWTLKAPFGISSLLITDSSGFMSDEEVGMINNKNLVQRMMYDLPNKWAQIAYFTGTELDKLKNICGNTNYHNHFCFEIINKIISEGGSFTSYSPKRMKVTDVDTSKDLKQAEIVVQ